MDHQLNTHTAATNDQKQLPPSLLLPLWSPPELIIAHQQYCTTHHRQHHHHPHGNQTWDALRQQNDTLLIDLSLLVKNGDDEKSYRADSSVQLSPSHAEDTHNGSSVSPTKADRLQSSSEKLQDRKLSSWLNYTSMLAHLTTFAILGVLVRYGLGVLFGKVLNVVNDNTALYLELPANMVGSFFMGWVGVVLKKDISLFSAHLAVGLSTGFMGSITSFSAWNQKMIALLTAGHWAAAMAGYLFGMELAQASLVVGIEAAKLFKWMMENIQQNQSTIRKVTPDNIYRQIISLSFFLSSSAILWVGSFTLGVKDTHSVERRTLWLACVVAPPGVWARWHLACLNGKGLGLKLKWLPIGTLVTNVTAASLEALLCVILLVVGNDDFSILIKSLQIGYLGCMSTVSTFVTEVYTAYGGPKPSRAFIYIFCTVTPSFLLGILIYSIPAWTRAYW